MLTRVEDGLWLDLSLVASIKIKETIVYVAQRDCNECVKKKCINDVEADRWVKHLVQLIDDEAPLVSTARSSTQRT